MSRNCLLRAGFQPAVAQPRTPVPASDIRCRWRARRRARPRALLAVRLLVVAVVVEVLDRPRRRRRRSRPCPCPGRCARSHILLDRAGGVADVEHGDPGLADLLHPLEALALERPVPHRQHLVGDEDVAVDVDGHREARDGRTCRRSSCRPGCRGTGRRRRSRRCRRTWRRSRPCVMPEHGGVHVDVLATGQLVVEAGAGRDQAGDPPAGQHLALVGAHHAADELEQGRLAGAVEAHQPDRLALLRP